MIDIRHIKNRVNLLLGGYNCSTECLTASCFCRKKVRNLLKVGCECENYTCGNLTANIEVDEVALEKSTLLKGYDDDDYSLGDWIFLDENGRDR